jgi:hypothetical protein
MVLPAAQLLQFFFTRINGCSCPTIAYVYNGPVRCSFCRLQQKTTMATSYFDLKLSLGYIQMKLLATLIDTITAG